MPVPLAVSGKPELEKIGNGWQKTTGLPFPSTWVLYRGDLRCSRTETAKGEANTFWEIRACATLRVLSFNSESTWCCWSIANELPMHPCAP